MVKTPEPASIQLRFVPLESLMVHEEDDPSRTKRLILALSRDGNLHNPIIVAKKGEYYVVLDGATRTSALKSMGFRDVLVQIVDYDSNTVELRSWYHVIVGLAASRLMADLGLIEGLSLHQIEKSSALALLGNREIEACIVRRDGIHYAITCQGDINRKAHMLCEMVGVYRGKAEVHRTTHIDIQILVEQYPHLTAVIAFPVFLPEEILEVAENSNRLPMGITRHIISGRALGLNVPLEKLTASQPLEVKNAWLDEKIRLLLHTNKIRLYMEPVFIFDE